MTRFYKMLGWEEPEIPEGYPQDPATRDRVHEWGLRLARQHPLYRPPDTDNSS